MTELEKLVEDIIEYTRTWSITETEWYWNVECVRKPSNINDNKITLKEFEIAIREEILYDLVYKKGSDLRKQMTNDCCNYESDYAIFQNDSKELEEKVKKIIKDFKVERHETKDLKKEAIKNLEELRKSISNMAHEDIYCELVNIAVDFDNKSKENWSLYNAIERYIECVDNEDFEYISKKDFNTIEDLICFVNDVEEAHIYKINGHGNLENVNDSDFIYCIDKLIEILKGEY